MVSYHEHNAREVGTADYQAAAKRRKLCHRHRRRYALHLRPGRGPGAAVRRERHRHQKVIQDRARRSAPLPCRVWTPASLYSRVLQPQANARRERLEELKLERRTIIFYEAPHKLCDTECDVSGAGRAQKITLARELTKVYEEVIRTTLSQAVELYTQRAARRVCAGGAGCQGGAEA